MIELSIGNTRPLDAQSLRTEQDSRIDFNRHKGDTSLAQQGSSDNVSAMITTRREALRYIEGVAKEAVDDFVSASLKDNELPMTEEQMEKDFREFLIGYLESEDEDEIVIASHAPSNQSDGDLARL